MSGLGNSSWRLWHFKGSPRLDKREAIQAKYCVPKGTQARISLAFGGIYQSFCGTVPGKAGGWACRGRQGPWISRLEQRGNSVPIPSPQAVQAGLSQTLVGPFPVPACLSPRSPPNSLGSSLPLGVGRSGFQAKPTPFSSPIRQTRWCQAAGRVWLAALEPLGESPGWGSEGRLPRRRTSWRMPRGFRGEEETPRLRAGSMTSVSVAQDPGRRHSAPPQPGELAPRLRPLLPDLPSWWLTAGLVS